MEPPRPVAVVASASLRTTRWKHRVGMGVVGHLDPTEPAFVDDRATPALMEFAHRLRRDRRLQHLPRTLVHILDAVFAGGLAAITIGTP